MLPRGADAAVDGDLLARGEVERAARDRARRARRVGDLVRRVAEREARVDQQRARVLLTAQDLDEPVLHRLVAADRAPEREALLRVASARPRARVSTRAERLGGDQRLGEVPRLGDVGRRHVEPGARRAGQRHRAQAPGRVVAPGALDAHAGGLRLDDAGDGRAAGVLADHDEHVGLRGVRRPRDDAVERDAVAVDARDRRGGARLAGDRVDGPARARACSAAAPAARRPSARRRRPPRSPRRRRGPAAATRAAGRAAARAPARGRPPAPRAWRRRRPGPRRRAPR